MQWSGAGTQNPLRVLITSMAINFLQACNDQTTLLDTMSIWAIWFVLYCQGARFLPEFCRRRTHLLLPKPFANGDQQSPACFSDLLAHYWVFLEGNCWDCWDCWSRLCGSISPHPCRGIALQGCKLILHPGLLLQDGVESCQQAAHIEQSYALQSEGHVQCSSVIHLDAYRHPAGSNLPC